ncbi:Gfo/Idh/MocA family oxidoreductase [Schumannella luteola]|uniref:Inositol 2-dehydrogenase n=1 Tax=Schumannella luteola TaxID=472059 RepID=A0A852Y651_9MICO|nr:Gfo/Idh/MocA family oxidoreductase [Schumannella luteola]NYG97753.1 myo-inositol 2-dehydrogenase/D-chiro-inositol 1-dehydrogenase [Schumannella luteola]TPX01384.1 Gfo/Idh/MocA family oxidoreductase [Schumannella luteola]
MTSKDLRVAVVGAGMMGADHIKRISHRISGAEVVTVVEPDEARAKAAVADLPEATTRTRIEDALEKDDLDAVLIATPGPFHEPVLYPALEAGVSILCEKPLTPDTETSLKVLEAEQKLDRPHIQVGFMRRFDEEYQALRQLIASKELGELLLVKAAHRNPSTPPQYTESMLITDSVVHEFDVLPWVTGETLKAVEVRKLKVNRNATIQEPQLVYLEFESGTVAEVEINVNMKFGYQVTTEAVFENGVAEIGKTAGLKQWHEGRWGGKEHESFVTRFVHAYDEQVQRWVDAARRGTIDGPSAWEGYLVAAACEAGVTAQQTGERVAVETIAKPAFYN